MVALTIIIAIIYFAWEPLEESYYKTKRRIQKLYRRTIKPSPYYKTYLVAKEQMHLEKQLGAFLFILSLWLIHCMVFFMGWEQHMLRPRTLEGLVGIFTSFLYHSTFAHLYSNSIGLFLFLPIFIFVRRNNIFTCIILMVIFKGMLGWFFGRSNPVLGASGLVYAIWGYLIFNGLLSKDLSKLLLSVALAFPTAWMFKGMNPMYTGERVSFEGHFFGLVAGVLVAWICYDRQKHSWIELEAEVPLTRVSG